jgi:hypothetical protein
MRGLEVWSLPGEAGDANEVGVDEAHAWIRRHRTEREPWQRSDATLARVADLRGVMVDGAAAVVRVTAGHVSVLQIAGDEGPLRELLRGVRSLGEVVGVVNLPAGDPASAALSALGATVTVRQHEMLREL